MNEPVMAGPPTCSCYPGEGPLPCPHQGALRDCWRAAVAEETQKHIVWLKSRDRTPDEESLLNYLKRVRCALELETSDFPNVSREAVPADRGETLAADYMPDECPLCHERHNVGNPCKGPAGERGQRGWMGGEHD